MTYLWPDNVRIRPIQQWPGEPRRGRKDPPFGAPTYWSWQDNLRAIALGLQALRAVDRYGVTKRGEQYTGWKQLPAGTPMPPAMTVDEAAAFIVEATGNPHWTSGDLVAPSGAVLWPEVEHGYKLAARRLHPDTGGSTEQFQQLQSAKRVLEAAR